MPKRVIHRFYVKDFDKLKDGDRYMSFCGKWYIACEPPAADECLEIELKTKNDPDCKACEKVLKMGKEQRRE